MAKKADSNNSRPLPEGALTHDFIICDNSVNRYKWRLLVAGIDVEGFMKNPVCCVQHNTWTVPIGKWLKLWIEGEQLKGTLEFDRNDENAVMYYWKYVDGYMSAVSLNIIPIEESDDSKLMLEGQRYSTITKSELLEVSVVTIPGQKNAVKLSTPEGGTYKLNLITTNSNPVMAKEEKTVEQLNAELTAQKKLNADMLVSMHKSRGVIADGEIDTLKKLALDNFDDIKQMLEARTPAPTETGAQEDGKQLAASLVELHAKRLGLTPDEKTFYTNSAVLDYEGTKKALEARKGSESVAGFLGGTGLGANGLGTQAANERDSWTYLDYYKKDHQGLLDMKKNEPEKYKQLEAAFVVESGKLGINTATEE